MRTWLLLGALVATLTGVDVKAAGGGCFVACAQPGEACTVGRDKSGEAIPIGPEMKPISDCLTRKSDKGTVRVAFRSKGKAGLVTVQSGQPFAEKLASYEVLDCLAGDPACEAGTLVTVRMGKGFGPDAPNEVAGRPCAVALPCGKVGLAPDGSLTIVLTEPARNGTLTFFPALGTGPGKPVDVKASVARVPPGTLEAGTTHRYRFTLSDGTTRAAGEFVVMSKQSQRDSDSALEQALKQPSAVRNQAAVESLMLDGRDWEAFQRTLAVSK